MNLTLLLFVVFSVFGLAFATVEIPERARGGLAWRASAPLVVTSASSANTALKWDAQVDNFDKSNNATFDQRYYVNEQYWTEASPGPVFFSIGGEGTLNGPPTGYVAKLGAQYNALLVSLEHRFYGESIPEGNSKTANLKVR